MAIGPADSVLPCLRRAALRGDGAGLTDGELLERFRGRRDEAAFEVLLRRHGPMVWGVCRRLLSNSADAEDAFQATFLVLLRKAAAIDPPQMVGNFLYGVAYHTARRARAAIARRRVKENEVRAMARPEADEKVEERLLALLDQELHALPDKYRVPIVLCELEGRTRKEAARQLGWAEGTVASRLARARGLLSRRLARHGLALSAGVLASALSRQTAPACVPALLALSTVKAVNRVAAGQATTAAFSTQVVALTEGVVRSMFLSKLKWAGVGVLVMALLGTSVGGFAYHGRAAEQDQPKVPAKAAKPAKPALPPRQAPAQVMQILGDALEAARTLEDKQWKAWMLADIATEQAKRGDKKAAARTFQEALEAAKDIKNLDGFAKFHTAHQIAGYMARSGDIEGARKIAEAIEHEDSRDYGLMEVAAAQARAGDIKGALKTAETIGTERRKSAALRVVVEVHAEAGRLKEASELAETIAEDFDRALAMTALAQARAKAKDRAAARKDLVEALKIADGTPEEHDDGPVTYAYVAKAQAEMGDVEEALKTANAIRNIKNEAWKNNALCFIVTAQAKAGDLQGALKTAEAIAGEYTKGEAMQAIVAARLRASDVKEATKLAESIASMAWRVQSLLEIAKYQAKKGERAAADKTFQKAFEEAENVRDKEPGMSNIRNAVLSYIVKAQAEAGEEKKALAWAAKQTSPLLKTQALFGIAQGLAQRQEKRKGSRE